DSSDEDQERRDLRMQLAVLHRDGRQDRGAQIDVLRELLAESAEDDEALAELARALVADDRHAEATDVLAERATLAEDDERRAALILESAQLFAGPLDDVASALERYEQVLQVVPGQDGAVADLVALSKTEDHYEPAGMMVMPQLEATGRFSELAAVLTARADLTSDPQERADSLRRLADVRLHRLQDTAGALASLGALIDTVEPNELPPVLEQAGQLAVQLGAGADHVDRLAQRAAQSDRDPDARVLIAADAARLAEDILGDNERALTLLTPLLDEGLANANVCTDVERLGRAVAAPAAVEQALREAVRLSEDDTARAELQVRLGQVQLTLGDGTGALESYRDAFEAGAGSDAIAGLEQVLEHEQGTASDALLDALEGAYQSIDDKAGRARVVQRRLAQAADADRPVLLEQLGGLFDEGGGTPGQALEAWGQLLALDPQSDTALSRVLALGREHAQLPQAVELMLAAIEAGEQEGRSTGALSLQAAQVLLTDLGQGGRALHVLDRMLADNPEHPEALACRVEAARAVGDASVLHEALGALAQVQPNPDDGARLWAEAAGVAENALVDPALAISDLDQVLSLDENHTEAWTRLLALLTAADDAERLGDALARRVMLTEDAQERRQLRGRLAGLLVERLDRVDDAIGTYQDMVADEPNDLEALQQLETLLRRLERWDDVRDTLEQRLEAVDGADRTRVLEQLATLSEEQLGDAGEAIERLQQILVEEPGHAEAEAGLERLLAAEERFVDLSELWQSQMDRARENGDADGHRQIASQLAALLAERLDDSDRAESILNQLLELDPSYVPALLSLASVYDARGDDEGMRQTLERAAALEPTGAEGAALHLRLANLAEDEPERRREHLESALRLDPGNAAAAAALMVVAREAEDWPRVASLLEIAVHTETDEQARRALELQRVDLLMNQLDNPSAALQVLHEIYETQQVRDDVEINRRIADGLFATQEYASAKGMYQWLVESVRAGRRNKILAHYLTRLARIVRHEGDDAAAREQLLEAYRVDTTNVETLIQLGTLYEQQQEWKDALKIYRTMLLQNADRSGLLRRGDIYVSLARAHLALEEKPKARAMLRRGLEEDADHPELAAQLEALG
nr:hypothetical protein [Deltaproteobacteria bacterium]